MPVFCSVYSKWSLANLRSVLSKAALEFFPNPAQIRAVHRDFCLIMPSCLVLLAASAVSHAQIPTTLTDKIYQGSGTINLLRDVSAADLQSFLANNGGLLLGVDVNENESGNESRESLGVAIKQMELILTTTAGTFSFTDFYTSTTAMIREAGSASAREFYTVFGRSGSSQITGGTAGFDLGAFDDVIRLSDVTFQGTLLAASLNVTFLSTAKTSTQGNETFFDYSGGFEDFALLGKQDAALLEAANFGVAAAPTGVSFTEQTATITPQEAGLPTPGAPAPPLMVLAALGVIAVYRSRVHDKS